MLSTQDSQKVDLFVVDDYLLYNSPAMNQIKDLPSVKVCKFSELHNEKYQGQKVFIRTQFEEFVKTSEWMKPSHEYDVAQICNLKHLAREKFKNCEFAKDFYFKVIQLNEESLFQLFNEELKEQIENGKKFYIKPIFGFCGYSSAEVDKTTDIAGLERLLKEEQKQFSDEINDVSKGMYIVEEMLGTTVMNELNAKREDIEIAVDMYYDSHGRPQITSIVHHPFTSLIERYTLHLTSKQLFEQFYEELQDFFIQVNEVLQVKSFPIHAEFKDRNGRLFPIELNPMIYGTQGFSEITYYAWGINAYVAFFTDQDLDWKTILAEKDDVYTAAVLGYASQDRELYTTDHEKYKQFLEKEVGELLLYMEANDEDDYCFSHAFVKTKDKQNLQKILDINFSEYFIQKIKE